MKLIIFTDLHYYGGDRATAIFGKTKKLTQYSVPMLEQLIQKVNNEYHPDAVINLGDSIQDSNTYEPDLQGLTYIANRFKEFEPPCYSVLGNHDMKMFDSHAEAKAIFGYDHFTYSLDLAGYHLVFLTTTIDPSVPNLGGGILKSHYMSKEDIAWLQQDLAETELPTLIFSHYAFFGKHEGEIFANAGDLIKIIEQSGKVKAAFSGHTHVPYLTSCKGVEYHVFGSPIASLAETDIPDAVYYEVDVTEAGIKATEHLFDICL